MKNGRLKETSCSQFVARGRQEEVDRFAGLVHGAVQVVPLALDAYIGLIHSPRVTHTAMSTHKLAVKRGRIPNCPSMYCRVVNIDAPLGEQLLDLPVRKWIREVPANRGQNDFLGKVAAAGVHC